jgi:SAM-dependent methyltransferase
MDTDKAYWDSIGRSGGVHHLERNVAEYKKAEHVRLLERWCSQMTPASVLKTDAYEEAFGCDSFMDWLESKAGSVYLMDVSSAILSRAKKNVNSAALLNASVSALPFKEPVFDLVVSNSTLDHLQREDLPSALAELSRVTDRGGTLVLTLDNAHNPLYHLGYILSNLLGLGGYRQARCYSAGEVTSMLADAGFVVDDVRSIVHLPTPFNLLARVASNINASIADVPIRFLIRLFSTLGLGGRNIHTGWFLAFKCTKNQSSPVRL